MDRAKFARPLFALRSPSLVTKLDGVHSQHSSHPVVMSMSLPRGGGGGHWSRQFSSHDDLCALNGHLTAANDEVLSSLFSRRRHQPSPEHSGLQALTPSTEGTRDSARKDFVQGVLPTERSRSVPPLDRLSAVTDVNGGKIYAPQLFLFWFCVVVAPLRALLKGDPGPRCGLRAAVCPRLERWCQYVKLRPNTPRGRCSPGLSRSPLRRSVVTVKLY